MPKNIVICSDGTGNRGGKTRGTNVWRVFNAVDRYSAGVKQITHYDDGVGTSGVRWMRLLGGAFGWGLSRNISSAYTFLAMNYEGKEEEEEEKKDKVFLFGFSRGAFTVRSLAGVISRCGLLKRDVLVNAGRRERAKLLKRILRAYRSAKKVDTSGLSEKDKDQRIRNALGIGDLDLHLRSIDIHFIGVWDTVDAVGMPIDELKRPLDCLYRSLFRRRLWGFHDRKLGSRVHHAYQALALDEERKTFDPNIWESQNDPKSIIEQVWFAGAHSNVGGGYPKDSLSLVSLNWMIEKAKACGLLFIQEKCKQYQADADAHGRLYDSRAGSGMFYRCALRNPYQQLSDSCAKPPVSLPPPVIHESVFERIERGTDNYAPKVIREDEYEVAGSLSGLNAAPENEDNR